jgi:hypothetical protein
MRKTRKMAVFLAAAAVVAGVAAPAEAATGRGLAGPPASGRLRARFWAIGGRLEP